MKLFLFFIIVYILFKCIFRGVTLTYNFKKATRYGRDGFDKSDESKIKTSRSDKKEKSVIVGEYIEYEEIKS